MPLGTMKPIRASILPASNAAISRVRQVDCGRSVSGVVAMPARICPIWATSCTNTEEGAGMAGCIDHSAEATPSGS